MLFLRPMYPRWLNICCCRCSFLDRCIYKALIFIVADALFGINVSATCSSLDLQMLFSLPGMYNCIHNGLPAKFCSLIHLACDNVHIENKYQSYSFLIAANGLNFIALSAGKYPATIPISIANAMEAITSQGGI